MQVNCYSLSLCFISIIILEMVMSNSNNIASLQTNATSSNTSNATIEYLYWTSMIFVRSYGCLMFSLGLIGHSLSIYALTRPKLRSNPCTRYFLASTFVGYFIVFVNVPLRTLEDGFYIDVFMYSTMHCKMLTFFLQWAR